MASFVDVHFPILAEQYATILLPSSSPARWQQRPATCARVGAVAVADCIYRSLRCCTRLYAPPLAAVATTAPDQCRETWGRNCKDRMNIVLVGKRSLYSCPGCVYAIILSQESATLQLCRTAASVGNTIYERSQMTDSRQHAESTTLQPRRTAAAVGNTIYVRVPCPRYAAASCLYRSLSFVTSPHHTFLLYTGTLIISNNLDRPINPALHIYVHRGSFSMIIFLFF